MLSVMSIEKKIAAIRLIWLELVQRIVLTSKPATKRVVKKQGFDPILRNLIRVTRRIDTFL